MPGFDALYKQTITLFNRVKGKYGEDTLWYPTIIDGVHLIVDKSSNWNSYGGQGADNVRLHIRYTQSGSDVMIKYIRSIFGDGSIEYGFKPWYEQKAWRRLVNPEEAITFSFGDNDDFDFFAAGALTEFNGPISDSLYERSGFYNHMNSYYDNVFAIKSVSKYNLIPHFEITGR